MVDDDATARDEGDGEREGNVLVPEAGTPLVDQEEHAPVCRQRVAVGETARPLGPAGGDLDSKASGRAIPGFDLDRRQAVAAAAGDRQEKDDDEGGRQRRWR